MAGEFWTYLTLGWRHIIDIHAYDHLLFVMTLCVTFKPYEIKRLLILITAFTVGHSITLVLATFNWLLLPSTWVEALIPCTIIATAAYNLYWVEKSNAEGRPVRDASADMGVHYALALGFGLIHGLGFAGYIKFLLGSEFSIWRQLLAFNIGLEIGQFCIVSVFMGVFALLLRYAGMNPRNWVMVISGAGGGIALTLLLRVLFPSN